jgi:hypothetical protein
MTFRLRRQVLFGSGVLLAVLGVLHIAVTPLIVHMLKNGLLPGAVAWLTPPMLLNHVVVGILLLPLGVLTVYASSGAANGVRWAVIVTRVIAVTIATLPPTLFALMGSRYFGAVPFRVATAIMCTACITLLVAAFYPAHGMNRRTTNQPE